MNNEKYVKNLLEGLIEREFNESLYLENDINTLLLERKEISDVLNHYLLKSDYMNYSTQILELMCCYNSLNKDYTELLKEENKLLLDMQKPPVPKCDWYISYKNARKAPKSEIFTAGYLNAGCEACMGIEVDRKCYIKLNEVK
jgi:hypothetical protein